MYNVTDGWQKQSRKVTVIRRAAETAAACPAVCDLKIINHQSKFLPQITPQKLYTFMITFTEFVERSILSLKETAASDAASAILAKRGRGNLSLHNFRSDQQEPTPIQRNQNQDTEIDAPVLKPRSAPTAPVDPLDKILPQKQRDMGRDPWAIPTDTEPSTEFGQGKKTKDYYNQVVYNNRSRSLTPEEKEEIVKLGQERYSALGIAMTMGDKFNKLIPTHQIKKILAANNIQVS